MNVNVLRFSLIGIVKRLQEFTDMAEFGIIFISFCVISKSFFETIGYLWNLFSCAAVFSPFKSFKVSNS